MSKRGLFDHNLCAALEKNGNSAQTVQQLYFIAFFGQEIDHLLFHREIIIFQAWGAI